MNERTVNLGSDFSFQNRKTFGEPRIDTKNIEFDRCLVETGADPYLLTTVSPSASNCLQIQGSIF